MEVVLVPNTHPDLKPISTRAYYDTEYNKYLHQLHYRGIHAISTFALVDPDKDKNHTGQFLVKVQRKLASGGYKYVVAKIDKDG